MGIVTVITSGTGGVGKSTVTSGISVALAKTGKKVLLIDADAGLRSLDSILGISAAIVHDIADVVSGNCELTQAIYCSKLQENIFILPAPANIKNKISPSVMKQLTRLLSPYYDHIFIDCPAGISFGFEAAVAAAERALIVCTPEPLCLRKVNIVNEKLRERGNIETRLVINKFSKAMFKKLRLYTDLDAVIDTAKVQLLGIIPEDFQIPLAAAKGLACQERRVLSAFDRMASRFLGEKNFLSAKDM